MTNPIVNYSTNQTISNELLSRSDVQSLVDTSLLTSGLPTYAAGTSYVTGNILYHLGIWYIAPSNIASGLGNPVTNTTWKQIPTWGSYTTTATAAGTTTLDLYSSEIQRFSGVTTQTVVLPVVTTLTALGKPFYFINDSTGTVTVNSSGGNLVATILGGQRVLINNILLTGTTAASWTVSNIDATVGLALKANIASPTFTGTVTVPTPFTIGAVSMTATGTELNYVVGVTSAIQTQINTKAPTASPTFTGTVTIPTPFTLGATSVTATGTELNYVDGVTSAIQTQLDAKAPLASPTFTGTVAMNGDLQLAENVSILLDAALSADGKWSGICESGVIGDTTVLFGELLYFKAADSRWWRTDADAKATSGPVKLGVCVVAGTAGDTRTIMLKGKINAASLYPALTIGAPVYIGATAGNIQVATPTSGFVRVVGYANTADELFFNPSNEYYELGDWTPILTFGGGSTGITYAVQAGHYKKSSHVIDGGCTIVLTNKGSSTGVALVTGYPYANLAGTKYNTSFAIAELSAILSTGFIQGSFSGSNSHITLQQTTLLGVQSATSNTDFANGSVIVLSGHTYY